MLEVANLIAVVGGDTTAHEVRQRARCHNCGVKGNDTYQIVYKGGSGVAMDGFRLRQRSDGGSHWLTKHNLSICGLNVAI